MKLNKRMYNDLMNIVHQLRESTKGRLNSDEFIKLYKEIKEITENPRDVDMLVWGDYYASEYFEENEDDELYELYTSSYSKAIDFIGCYTHEYNRLFNELLKHSLCAETDWIEKKFEIYGFEIFTTLD